MKIKAVSGIIVTLLLIGMLTLAFNIQPLKADPTTIIVPDHYEKIQWAIGNASDGDTIFVRAGTYYEHVVVNKRVSLIGENKHNTIIDGNSTGTVIEITASNVTITGFTIQKSGSYYPPPGVWSSGNNYEGIRLIGSSNNSISGNIIANNQNGVTLRRSSNNSISGNIIANNCDGIWLSESSSNSLSRNNIMANNDGSIRIRDSSNNVISENNITDIGWVGIVLACSSENNISGNNVRGINNNYCGIQLYYSSYDSISGNNITNNGHGIHLYFSSYNLISGNNITSNNKHGIYLDNWSLHNLISGNNVAYNGRGIGIENDSSNNSIYHNNFVDNIEQVYSDGLTNVWDDGYPSGGNYWSDYTGVDEKRGPDQDKPGSDGIGDTPYTRHNVEDRYPLMNPCSLLDVAVVSVVPAFSEAYPAWKVPLAVSVTVENVGDETATFTVTAYYDENIVETLAVTELAPGTTTELTFNWNLTEVSWGLYTIRAVATLEEDTHQTDNELVNGTVKVKMNGDVTGDGDVDGEDYLHLAGWYGWYGIPPPIPPPYLEECDIDHDGDVDGEDYWLFSGYYGRHTDAYPPDP